MTEPADAEPADTEPADTEPADTEPALTEPAAESALTESEPAASAPAELSGTPAGRRSSRTRSRTAPALLVLALVGLGVGVALNPPSGRAPAASPEEELLNDGRFTLSPPDSPWTGEFRATRMGAFLEDTTIAQHLEFAATDRSYRFRAQLRRPPGEGDAAAGASETSGVVRMLTRCPNGEAAVTPFSVGEAWVEVSATLDPLRATGCSLGVEIEARGPLVVRTTSVYDAGLANASFEDNTVGWTVGSGGSAVRIDTLDVPKAAGTPTASTRTGPSAVPGSAGGPSAGGPSPVVASTDGARVGRIRGAAGMGSISQDVVLDPSSEQVAARARIAVRAAAGAARPTDLATVALWALCDTPEQATKTFRATEQWQLIEVQLTPKQTLLRPNKPPCVLRLEIYPGTGPALLLDAAELRIRTAVPPKRLPPPKLTSIK